jgi:hypothetical protein
MRNLLSIVPWRHMRSGGVAPPFLILGLGGGKLSASRPGRFTPKKKSSGTHWMGCLMGPKTSLNSVTPAVNRTPAFQPVDRRCIAWERINKELGPSQCQEMDNIGLTVALVRVNWSLIVINVKKKITFSFWFRRKVELCEKWTYTLQLWKWRRHVHLKLHYEPINLYDVTAQYKQS